MNLAFINNQTFIWTVMLTQWQLLYGSLLAGASFAMQIRSNAGSSIAEYSWSSAPSAGQGTIIYQPSSGALIMRASYPDMLRVPDGTYVYDLQMNVSVPSLADPLVKDFTSGTIVIGVGVTR
jgi:hypothetical protein